VFQSFNLIPFKTALENVALPLFYRGIARRKRNAVALDYLDRVGIADWAAHHPYELSGGQQQRVAIARALINDPKVILADEPTGALDSQTSYEVMELLRTIHRAGTTVVIVTHEHDISEMTDRIIHLKDGVVGDGRPPEARAGV
jgi:putative ABC transport system ATP-binding protein